MLKSTTKHILHCILLFFVISMFFFITRFLTRDLHTDHGGFWTTLSYTLRFIAFLPLPHIFCCFFGLVFYNAFPDDVVLKGSPFLAQFICIRVVTRGNYPDLVKKNVRRNIATCRNAGLVNFMIEVVTDKAINLPKHKRVRETVVPKKYRTKSGALFKARALQYCLEDKVNILNPNDWIVHLDEETILTESSIRGILNFVLDGKYPFGQGLITYANEKVVNWFTTIADANRVSDDMGKLRFQFKAFHKVPFSWKGSFIVAQYHAEKDVSFDNGIDGSVAEDCFFAMKALSKGYSFDFIDGEMHEQSPYTILDYMRQRRRWLQGIVLVTHSPAIPFKFKVLLATGTYSWILMPLSFVNFYLNSFKPITFPLILDLFYSFFGGMSIYMFIFGILKSFPLRQLGIFKSILCFIGIIFMMLSNLIVESFAIFSGLLSKKHKFYVIQKESFKTIKT